MFTLEESNLTLECTYPSNFNLRKWYIRPNLTKLHSLSKKRWRNYLWMVWHIRPFLSTLRQCGVNTVVHPKHMGRNLRIMHTANNSFSTRISRIQIWEPWKHVGLKIGEVVSTKSETSKQITIPKQENHMLIVGNITFIRLGYPMQKHAWQF